MKLKHKIILEVGQT